MPRALATFEISDVGLIEQVVTFILGRQDLLFVTYLVFADATKALILKCKDILCIGDPGDLILGWGNG